MGIIHLAARVLAIPALLALPGYVIFSLFAGEEGHREGLSVIEACFSWVFLSLLLTSLCGLVLAELGRFSLPLLLLLVDVPILILALLGWRRLYSLPFLLRWDRWQTAVLMLLLLSGVLFFLHPFENIFVGRDAGVYVNTGVNIAKTGAISRYDGFFARLPTGAREEILRPFPGTEQMGFRSRLPGFYWVEEKGLVVPLFLHLYPVWIAIFYALFGLEGSLLATPFAAWLAVVALYLLGKTLFDRRVGLVAVALMTVNASQIWFARYANADILFQLLFLGGVLYWALFVRHGHPLWGVISGTCFGEALLTKADAQYLLIPLALVLGYLLLVGLDRRFWYFLVPLGALGGLAALHISVFAWPYYRMSWGFVSRSLSFRVMLSLVLLLALALMALRRAERTKVIIAIFGAGQRYLLLVLAVGVIVLGLYLYFVLPYQPSPGYEIRGTMVKPYTEENFVRLGWYLTPVGLFLAVIGLAQAIRVRADIETTPLLLSALTYSAVNLPMRMAIPDHIAAIRRYVSVVIPLAVLFTSYALCHLLQGKDRLGRAKHISFAAIVILLLMGCLHRSAIVIPHREFAGALAQVDRIAKELPPRSVAIFENQSLLGYFLAPPLTFIHGREAIFAWVSELSPGSYAAVVEAGLDEGREVFFFSEHGRQILLSQYDLVSQWAATLDVPELERALDHFPSRIDRFQLPYRLYRVQPGSGMVVFRADSLPKQVGRDVENDAALSGLGREATVAQDQEGFLSYGPYAVFPPGGYQAVFRLGIAELAEQRPVAQIDVAAEEGNTVLGFKEVDTSDFSLAGRYREFSLGFTNPVTQALEFRTLFLGGADLWLDSIAVLPRGQSLDSSGEPVFEVGGEAWSEK